MLLCISSFAVSHTEEVYLHTNSIHVPKGFDSNDNLEVILTGDLPDTCYRRPFGNVKLQNGKINIDVKATVVRDENVVCIKAVVPYLISVPLGQLPEGNYPIIVNEVGNSAKEAKIVVEKPHSLSIDNFTYANVTAINTTSEKDTVLLSGFHPSSCMKIDRVELIFNDTNDTVAVLPIIIQLEDKPICDRMVVPFDYEIKIPNLSQQNVLLHVRELHGNARNFLINNLSSQ